MLEQQLFLLPKVSITFSFESQYTSHEKCQIRRLGDWNFALSEEWGQYSTRLHKWLHPCALNLTQRSLIQSACMWFRTEHLSFKQVCPKTTETFLEFGKKLYTQSFGEDTYLQLRRNFTMLVPPWIQSSFIQVMFLIIINCTPASYTKLWCSFLRSAYLLLLSKIE